MQGEEDLWYQDAVPCVHRVAERLVHLQRAFFVRFVGFRNLAQWNQQVCDDDDDSDGIDDEKRMSEYEAERSGIESLSLSTYSRCCRYVWFCCRTVHGLGGSSSVNKIAARTCDSDATGRGKRQYRSVL